MTTHNGMRDALIRAGLKESPLAMVERLYERWRRKYFIANPKHRNVRVCEQLRDKITQICTDRNITNPFFTNGEIKYIEEKKNERHAGSAR